MNIKEYGYRIAIGIDQMFNVVLGGYPDETLSSRTWRKSIKENSKWRWRALRRLIDGLFIWQGSNHCQRAYKAELNRKHSPIK